jgi:hypothetical protein
MAREWHLSEALHSFRRLKSILDTLTEEEVIAALKLETASRRRLTVMRLLSAQAEKLHLRSFNANLKENIHGT